MMFRPLPVLACLALTACAAGPDYTAPEIGLTSTFAEGDAGPIGQVGARRWWTDLNDPLLNDLVTRGLAQNLSLAAAEERIAAARAALAQTGVRAAVDGGLSAGSTRGGSDVQAAGTRSSTTLTADIAIDLFGRVARARQSAAADLGAAEAGAGVTRLAYLSGIVGAYIEARYAQNALALTRQTITTRERTLEITRNQRASGAATELDEAQVLALLDTARADIPRLEATFLSNVYALATLLAEPAAPLVTRMQRGAPQPRPRGTAATGIPADLVRNRPDVRQAERQFAAAVADVGVAAAQMYPSLSLSGSVTEGGNSAWSFGPSITQAILGLPRQRAARQQAEAQAREAEIAWRAAVLDAVEDVQTTNSTWRRDQQRAALLGRSVGSYDRALTLSQENFSAGALSLLDLLDTDRALAQARLAEAAAIRDVAVNWATLQVALGAGAFAR
ncbi:efflux transporter outer membrane subunit [Falsirhodobacter halotolerans]|uniref:efflux transporter outer membrane subunit n=1 Tax=Falsirhodobacter halotolerans TaxID=1146892 RepID=UPI001FD42D76|nr:efflux transporter outer membrane subunit [Falsirhodobacter halotolerans]MCJ8139006.1 efflux transporter outer membrane subunit [Falsirhodobacter halotolerans]